jgi:hypothetical protein
VAIIQLPTKRRRYGVEREWLPLLGAGHSALRSALIATGVSAPVAGNLVWFLEDQATLDRSLSERTRNNYRHVLEGLDRTAVEAALRMRAIPG